MPDKEKQRCVIVCGTSGVGKTATARLLSRELHAIRLTSEEVIKDMFKETSNQNKDKDFTKEELDIGYHTMNTLAKKLLDCGFSVVLDGVFRSQEQRNDVINMTREREVICHTILVTCPEDIIKERIIKRFEAGVQPGGWENHIYLKSVFEPLQHGYNIVDSSLDVEEQVKKLISDNFFDDKH